MTHQLEGTIYIEETPNQDACFWADLPYFDELAARAGGDHVAVGAEVEGVHALVVVLAGPSVSANIFYHQTRTIHPLVFFLLTEKTIGLSLRIGKILGLNASPWFIPEFVPKLIIDLFSNSDPI